MGGTQIFNGNQSQEIKTFKPSTRPTSILGLEEKRGTAKTSNALVLDISGSTSDPIGCGDNRQKLIGIKESVTSFLTNLPSTAMVAVIVFDGTVRCLRNMAVIGANKIQIIQQIQSMQPGTTTAMEEALIAAEREFISVPAGFTKRLFLLTDGIPNTDPRAVAENIKLKVTELYTIGFGEGYQIDDDLLKEMASIGSSGTPLYYHFTDSKQLTGFMTRVSKRL